MPCLTAEAHSYLTQRALSTQRTFLRVVYLSRKRKSAKLVISQRGKGAKNTFQQQRRGERYISQRGKEYIINRKERGGRKTVGVRNKAWLLEKNKNSRHGEEASDVAICI